MNIIEAFATKKGGRLALPLQRLCYQVLDTQKIKAKPQIERRYTHERNTIKAALAAALGALCGHATIGANNDAVSLIHLVAGDTLRIKEVGLPAANDSYSAIALYNASGTFNVANYLHNGFAWNCMTFNNAGDIVTVTVGSEYYIRVSLICTDASAVIATINEAIE